MPTARKTPSGKWKVRVYDYVDENKVKHYKAFTANSKKEAELMALSYTHQDKTSKLTFFEATMLYIQSRESVIAPSTLKEYKRSAEKDFELIKDKDINKLTQEDIQKQINEHSKKKSAKTVYNIHGLISSVLKIYRPDFILQTTLPQKEPKDNYIPNDSDIKKILEYTKQHDQEMHTAIMLAAFGTLRRSEICGLKSSDIKDNTIHIKRAIVNSDNGWTQKGTKTTSSDRTITLPDFVIDEISHKKGNIVQLKPNMISDRFIDIVVRCGLPHFTFHSLRHYCASRMHSMGIPDAYIMEKGGWSSDVVLKQVYRHALSEESNKFNDQVNAKFAEIFDE